MKIIIIVSKRQEDITTLKLSLVHILYSVLSAVLLFLSLIHFIANNVLLLSLFELNSWLLFLTQLILLDI